MAECASIDELNAKCLANNVIDGFGIGNVHTTIACPFCGEPGFLKYEILEVEKKMTEGAVCSHCNRGCRAEFVHDKGSIGFCLVQTSGPDVPDWYQPKMRRASDT